MDDFISKLDEYKISYSLSEVIQRSLDKCSLTSGKQQFLLPSSIEDRATCIYQRKKTACRTAVCVPRSSSPTLHKVLVNLQHTVLQSKRANFVGFKIFCYFQESVQEGSTLSLWEDTTSTCTALLEVTCYHVI